MEETEQVVWTVGVGFMEVGSFDNEAEALGCFNEYCSDPSETVTVYKDGVMEDRRDGETADEEESEEEGE